MYSVLLEFDNEEFLIPVASLNELDEAKRVLESIKEHWPGNYRIRDTEAVDQHRPVIAIEA